MEDRIIKDYKGFSELENGIHVLHYTWYDDFFSYEGQLQGYVNIRKTVLKKLANFFIVEKGSRVSCLFFESTFADKKRDFITKLNDMSFYEEPENLDVYDDDDADKNHIWFFLDQFCRWTDSEETDVRALVHKKNGYVVGFITKDGVPIDSVIVREYYKGLLVKKSINELEKECGDDKAEYEIEKEEDIVADIERLAKCGEETENEKSMIFPRFDFQSKICASCDKPFGLYDFIIKPKSSRVYYCPKCARNELLAADVNTGHERYLEYICEGESSWLLAHLVVDKRIFTELDNGLYKLAFQKCYEKMLYVRRKYIYETVRWFASETISKCILEKNDDFACLFFGWFKRWKESFFLEPYGEVKKLMDYFSEWTEREVNLLVDKEGYVRGFISGSEMCDKSLIVKEYYDGELVIRRIEDL